MGHDETIAWMIQEAMKAWKSAKELETAACLLVTHSAESDLASIGIVLGTDVIVNFREEKVKAQFEGALAGWDCSHENIRPTARVRFYTKSGKLSRQVKEYGPWIYDAMEPVKGRPDA